MDSRINKDFSEKAYILMKTLYEPKEWCERFIFEIKYWLSLKNTENKI